MKTCVQLQVMRECSCYTARLPSGGNITAYDVIEVDQLLPCDDESLSDSRRSELKRPPNSYNGV